MQITDLGGGRGWLDYPAALSLFRLDARIGHLWQISEAGRTWEQQNKFRQDYLNRVPGASFALPAGTSIHERGRAIDTNERIVWLLNEYGWFQTALAIGEEWHFEYDASRDQHYNEGAPAGGGAVDFEENDMTPEQDQILRNIAGFIYAGGTSTADPNYFGSDGTLYNRVRNMEAHLYAGGPSAADPNYVGAIGTVYNLLKSPVMRSSASNPTALPDNASPVKISQVQDNADTNTMLRKLVAEDGVLLTDEQVEVFAKTIVDGVIKALTEDQTQPPKA